MSPTIRKNFVFDEEIARHLEELAKDTNQSMTSLIQEMTEERYKSIKVKKRLKAFHKSVELAHSLGKGLFVGKSIQSIKGEMNV